MASRFMTQETDNDTARENHGYPENEPFKNLPPQGGNSEEPVRRKSACCVW